MSADKNEVCARKGRYERKKITGRNRTYLTLSHLEIGSYIRAAFEFGNPIVLPIKTHKELCLFLQ